MKLSGSWSLVKGKSRLSTGCVATNCPAAFCTRTERSKGSALFDFHIPLSTLFHTAVQQHWLLRCKGEVSAESTGDDAEDQGHCCNSARSSAAPLFALEHMFCLLPCLSGLPGRENAQMLQAESKCCSMQGMHLRDSIDAAEKTLKHDGIPLYRNIMGDSPSAWGLCMLCWSAVWLAVFACSAKICTVRKSPMG